MSDETVTVRLPVGIPGSPDDPLRDVERTIPRDEPPPLPPNADLSVIGKPTPRLDGRAKVTGQARYTSDVRLPGMLYGRVVRSPHAHARVRSIDVTAAQKFPGVRAVHVVEHLRTGAVLRDPSKEVPSAHPIVRYAGQPIAAVAAATPDAADEAARLVKVDYEVLPFVVDLEEARKPGAPLVFPGPADQAASAGGGGGAGGVPQTGNVRGPARTEKGSDVEAALKAADVRVDMTFRTQVQTHSALETHGVVADFQGGQLTVYASTQGTHTVQDELATVFDLKKSQVRVITEFMGGGFGAKFGAGNFGVLATHLSKKAGAPVRLMLDRKEEHLGVGNRPSSVQRLRIGANKDGTLTAIHLESYGTGGTGTGAGTSGPVKNMYVAPNLVTEEYDVFTNAGPAAAFRAPGHPQGCFALEQAIDALAEKLGKDAMALRDKIDESAARREERRIAAKELWSSRRQRPGSDPGPVKVGVGMAQSIWYRFVDLDATCEVRISRDGAVELYSAVQDIGTGIRTALAQVVAEELGLRAEDVTVRIGDTTYPTGTASGGSKTTGSITPAARNAAYGAKRQLFDQVATALGSPATSLVVKDGKVFPKGDPSRAIAFRAACAKLRTEQIAARASRSDEYGGSEKEMGRSRMGIGGYGGVQVAEVSVDTETGLVKVKRVLAVHDCGRPLNPLGITSQIQGGIIQGISYALYEDRVLDRRTGRMLNVNLDQYKIAGAREVPPIDVRFIEEYRGRNSTDAGGIGEPATIPTCAAIANAVYNATGARVLELPMTPARVLAALHQKETR